MSSFFFEKKNFLNFIFYIYRETKSQQQQQQRRHIIQPAIREKINNALHSGNVNQLEELLLDGYGGELIGRTSFDEDARKFLKSIPQSMERIHELHSSIINGEIEMAMEILTKNPQFARTRDQNSFTPFHLAVINGHVDLIGHLAENFPTMINTKDNVSGIYFSKKKIFLFACLNCF